jgi:oxygen-dependent protoporphyrinogen oxidase
MKKVAIIGGGVTGLSAAYTIKKAIENGADIDYVVLEKSSRLGGKINTLRTDDGYVIEGGPDCFVSTKPSVFNLANELQCEDRLIGSNDHDKKTYVLVKGKLCELPDGIMMMVPTKIKPFITTNLFSWPGKMRMAMDLFIAKKQDPGDESLASFVNRRLGKEALDRIAEPLVAGIHAGDPETMSLAATFPNFLDMEQKYGSLIKGMLTAMKHKPAGQGSQGPLGTQHGKQDSPNGSSGASQSSKPAGAKPVNAKGNGSNTASCPAGHGNSPEPKAKRTFFMSFKGGMQDIIDALFEALDKDKIVMNTSVSSVEEIVKTDGGRSYKLKINDGKTMEVDAVILALPASATANIVQEIDKPLAEVLRDIPMVSSATVTMAFKKKDLSCDLKGFGFVVPHVEGRKIMATTWSSTKWSYRTPDDEHVIIRAFVGGAKAQHLAGMKDDEMKSAVLHELKSIMGVDAEPVHVWIFHWDKGMPQYTMGHLDRVKEISERVVTHQGLFTCGGSYAGVGVPDCINSGTKAAESAIDLLQRS